jgi:hypothetical protein
MSKSESNKRMAASLKLALDAVERCRELLINADADAEDLAEYDAARQGLRYTIEEWFERQPA